MSGTINRLKDPAYTGQNRCLPCTAVNAVIAVTVAALLGVVWLPAGGAALLVSVLVIYFRGYHVPGTPTLTKRYLPQRVLSWFGKGPETTQTAADPEVDVAGRLLEAGLLRDGGDDLYLTDDTREAWQAEIAAVRDRDLGPADVADLLGDADALDLTSYETGWVATSGGTAVGRWESRAALIADVAAVDILSDRLPGWTEAPPAIRGEFLGGLRLFLDRCPACDGAVEFGTETVESCCAEREVVAVTCTDCGARLLETDAP